MTCTGRPLKCNVAAVEGVPVIARLHAGQLLARLSVPNSCAHHQTLATTWPRRPRIREEQKINQEEDAERCGFAPDVLQRYRTRCPERFPAVKNQKNGTGSQMSERRRRRSVALGPDNSTNTDGPNHFICPASSPGRSTVNATASPGPTMGIGFIEWSGRHYPERVPHSLSTPVV